MQRIDENVQPVYRSLVSSSGRNRCPPDAAAQALIGAALSGCSLPKTSERCRTPDPADESTSAGSWSIPRGRSAESAGVPLRAVRRIHVVQVCLANRERDSRNRGVAKSRKRRNFSGIMLRETWTSWIGTGSSSKESSTISSLPASTASAT